MIVCFWNFMFLFTKSVVPMFSKLLINFFLLQCIWYCYISCFSFLMYHFLKWKKKKTAPKKIRLQRSEESKNTLDFSGGSVVKNLPANTGDADSIPGSGRSSGEGNGNPVQYSCLENTMDRGVRQATVHGVTRVGHNLATKSQAF